MDKIIEKAVSLDDRAAVAKQSQDEMERLIEDFIPFLRASVDRYSSRFNQNQREELFSAAIEAFYESIRSYDISKGHFFPFTKRVINARIIDYTRKAHRNNVLTISLDEREDEAASAQSGVIAEMSIRAFDEERRRELLTEEIEQFKAELATWGITMDSLVKQSPKHQKLRETYRTAVLKICQEPDIIQTIQLKRYLPIKAISKITELPQKKLDRARTFILASLIIKMGEYNHLFEYVQWDR